MPVVNELPDCLLFRDKGEFKIEERLAALLGLDRQEECLLDKTLSVIGMAMIHHGNGQDFSLGFWTDHERGDEAVVACCARKTRCAQNNNRETVVRRQNSDCAFSCVCL